MTIEVKSTLAAYTPEEVDAIVAVRCRELAEMLGWSLTPPPVRRLDPAALADAVRDDVRVRGERIRGGPRSQGFFSGLAERLVRQLGAPTLGYFAAGDGTLYLNAVLVPAQAGYVLMHELTHAAQFQNFPALFAAVDAARVRAEDAMDKDGDAPEAKAARGRYEALVTFLEGHATGVGRRACEQRLLRDAPDAAPEEVKALVAALMGLNLDDETVKHIYVRGEQLVSSLDPAGLQALFCDPGAVLRTFGAPAG